VETRAYTWNPDTSISLVFHTVTQQLMHHHFHPLCFLNLHDLRDSIARHASIALTYVEMLAKRWEEPIMGKSVEKVAKSGEKWGGMWITFHWHAPDKAPNQRR
jgi:hypothetical protein